MDEEKRKAFGEYLKRLRLAANLSLRQVEAQVDISNSYLYQIEKGERNPPKLEIMERLALLYGVSLDMLTEAARTIPPADQDLRRKRLHNAYLLVTRDPDYISGMQLDPDNMNDDVKRFIVFMYEKATGTKLLSD
jgi:transcriptional regulator with XRE-family HTH domain